MNGGRLMVGSGSILAWTWDTGDTGQCGSSRIRISGGRLMFNTNTTTEDTELLRLCFFSVRSVVNPLAGRVGGNGMERCEMTMRALLEFPVGYIQTIPVFRGRSVPEGLRAG